MNMIALDKIIRHGCKYDAKKGEYLKNNPIFYIEIIKIKDVANITSKLIKYVETKPRHLNTLKPLKINRRYHEPFFYKN